MQFSPRTDCDWVAAHLHFEAGELYGKAADEVIRRIVSPVAEYCFTRGLTDRMFFIRYSEKGKHIRLRLGGSAATAHERRQIVDEVAASVSSRGQCSASSGLRVETSTSSTSRVVDTVRWMDYEPETLRYGGSQAIWIAEDVFDCSSKAALALLTTRYDARAPRVGAAVAAIVCSLIALADSREDALEVSEATSAQYQRRAGSFSAGQAQLAHLDHAIDTRRDSLYAMLESLWLQNRAGDAGSSALDAYRTGLSRAREALTVMCQNGLVASTGGSLPNWRACAAFLGPSYIHMMNNRIGITLAEEAYLARLLVRWLQESTSQVE